MYTLPYKHLIDTVHEYDLILLDLWGVIIDGNEIYPGVVDTINTIIQKTEVLFVSNTPYPNFIVVKNLLNWGLRGITSRNVLTSGDITRNIIQDRDTTSLLCNKKLPVIYHLGANRNSDLLMDIDHVITDDINQADIMLLSLYVKEEKNINKLYDLLKHSAKRATMLIICSNPDTTILTQGKLTYCAGYFAEIIKNFGGKVMYTGKPHSIIYKEVLKRNIHIQPQRMLMVGDTFETDILGANQAGIASALTMTGNSYGFHKMYHHIEHKIEALYRRAKEINIVPTFITNIL